MNESKASRTLLKSPPELWSEVSTAASLQRHMDQFGEIRITKLEPETAVAWEGEHARGTITLEASGWGTRVSLTAEPAATGAVDEAQPEAASQPVHADLVQRSPSGMAQPAAAGDCAEPASGNDAAEPERVRVVVEPEPTDARLPDATIYVRQSQIDESIQKPRWTRRLARAFRKWLRGAPREEAEPVGRAPASDPPATFLTVPAPVVPEVPATAPRPILRREPEPQQEPPSQVDDASTTALDATLDSLGQAHHRPFSRA